jgi:hypothetical protein
VFRLRRLNAAEPGANKASDLQREAQPQQQEQHRRQLSRVHRRSSKNVVASQRDEPVRSQIARKVGQNRCRRRNAYLSVNDSRRRRPWAQVNVSSVAEVHHLDFGNRSHSHRVAPMKRVVQEKEHRARMANRLRRQPVERVKLAPKEKEFRARRLSSSSSSAAARLAQPITAKDKGNPKVGRKEHQKKRHRHVSNNFVDNTSGSGTKKLRSPLFSKAEL